MDKEESKKVFGENLRRIRTARGMSQEELAKALGYTNRSSINKIEIGRSNIPTDKIKRAAEVLGVSPLDLFQTAEGENMPEFEFVESDVLWEYNQLTEANQALTKAYIKGLLDSQKGDR